MTDNTDINKEKKTTTHKIGIYLWIWGLLFVLSFFSYMVDWYQFQGLLRWTLILTFMFLKEGLIMAFFMHCIGQRYYFDRMRFTRFFTIRIGSTH